MKFLIYSVFDSKVQIYDKPFQMQTRGEALRAFEAACNDPGTSLSKWPQDFTLFELGVYESATGKYENHNTPISMGLASEFKKPDAPRQFPNIAAAPREGVNQ